MIGRAAIYGGNPKMELGLEDKVAIVGGGSRGLGRACALGLSREGTRVAICSRNLEAITQGAARDA